jgi:GNAT superfamily N-acetyltransferase
VSEQQLTSTTDPPFVVRALQPDDALALNSCVFDCYGDTYPKRDLYDVDLLRNAVTSGRYNGVVVIDPSNAVLVGHIGWVRHAEVATTVEAGATMVRPTYRGGGVLKQLGRALHDQLKQNGAAGYVHFPTTAHTVMQRASVSSGGAETGLLLGYLPASLDVAGFAGPRDRRLAVTVAYQPLGVASSETIVATSEREAAWLTEVSLTLGLQRTINVMTNSPVHDASEISKSYSESRELLTLTISRIGRDLVAEVDTAMRSQPSLLVHVDLDATDVAVTWARQELASIGFVFGAWLPGWCGPDALRVQRINDHARVDLQPELFSFEARAILERITTNLEST